MKWKALLRSRHVLHAGCSGRDLRQLGVLIRGVTPTLSASPWSWQSRRSQRHSRGRGGDAPSLPNLRPSKLSQRTAVSAYFVSSPGGLNGSDNLRQLTEDVQILISQDVQGIEPTFVLVPQCPEGDQWANGAMGNPPFHNYDHNAVPESASSKLTFRVLDEVLHDFRIDRSRLYVTGPSMGDPERGIS